ncbi:hypothetical protein [Spongiimicrobium salis]|uniref:hypothetical protein n=1 Tax=Spongiimicrobium salis TaxID=1667022 RepID=UPI00374D5DF0
MSIFKSTRLHIGIYMFIFTLCGRGQAQANHLKNYPSLGISFEVPKAWTGQDVENGFLLSSSEIPGFILLTTHNLKNMKEIQQEMEQGFVIGANTKLIPMGIPQKITSNTIGGQYSGIISGKSAQAYILGMWNEFGLGLTLICGANSNSYAEHLKKSGLAIAKSVIFSSPKEGDILGNVPSDLEEWKKKFSNCRLTYMESYTSYGSGSYGKKIKIDLCDKGYFNHSSYGSMSVSGGEYNAGQGTSQQGAGTWTILQKQEQIALQLHFYNGEVYEYFVTIDGDDKTYLNGNRYFRTYEGAGKYSPKCD